MTLAYTHIDRLKKDEPFLIYNGAKKVTTDLDGIGEDTTDLKIRGLNSFGTTSTKSIAQKISILLKTGIRVELIESGVFLDPSDLNITRLFREFSDLSLTRKIDKQKMRQMLLDGETITNIANSFGVCRQTVHWMWNKEFQDIPKNRITVAQGMKRAQETGTRLGRPPSSSKVNPQTLREMRAKGDSVRVIAEYFEVVPATVYYALRKQRGEIPSV